MKYDQESFNKAVAYYSDILIKEKPGSIFIHGLFNSDAFLSIAPLSRAAHDLGIDMNVKLADREIKLALLDVWDAFIGNKGEEAKHALQAFIDVADKKIKKDFKKIFARPDLILFPGEGKFEGDRVLEYQKDWFRSYRSEEMDETGKLIIKECINPQKDEIMASGFVLLPPSSWEEPLEDYLDSYAISLAVIQNALGKYRLLRIPASTSRLSQLDDPELVSELSATLQGCEASKDIDEPVFMQYKKVSGHLNLSRIEPSNAVFGFKAKGYHGRHYFGEAIGYPTPDKKSRWDSAAGIFYKFSWYPQSHVDTRKPKSRIAFTSTLPIDIFIDSVNIDYKEMRARNKKIMDMLDMSDKVVIKSHIEDGSDFEVGLLKQDGTHREVKPSDSDARFLLSPYFLERGKEFGMMANIPGGEAFTTPGSVDGMIVGDVIIHVDKSHKLSDEDPLIIEAENRTYKIKQGPEKILGKIKEKKDESWERILEQEKNNSVPKEIVELKKKNFESIGEFAINTNPKARLCDYLIVNEKIANMIHVALGSGFEQDTATEYHMDIVIDSIRQKLDIYGLDSDGEEHWIIKSGKFVV